MKFSENKKDRINNCFNCPDYTRCYYYKNKQLCAKLQKEFYMKSKNYE